MANHDVSVVIPAYRAAGTVARAVDSVLAQSCPAREILVIDDGSPDDLATALAPYRDRITLIRKRNGGAASARNAGIDRACGDVIAFLDADDHWEPHKLARQLAVLDAHPEVGLVGSPYLMQAPDGRRALDPSVDRALCGRVLALRGAAAFAATSMFWTGTIVVRRDVLGDARFDEALVTAEDRDLWLRLLLVTRAYLVAEPLATCVLVDGSLSRTNVERDCKNLLALVDRYRRLLGPVEHARWIADTYRRWAGRLLAQGEPRAALAPALQRLRRDPSPQAVWIIAKAAVQTALRRRPRALPESELDARLRRVRPADVPA